MTDKLQEWLDAAGDRFAADDEQITLPARNVIDTPAEFQGDADQLERWALALHEAGHAVIAQLRGGCGGLGIERMSGEWRGVAYDQLPSGESCYLVALAGAAAESLGADNGRLSLDHSDFTAARDELRVRGVREQDIVRTIGRDLVTMTDEFSNRWTNAIRSIAIEVCKRGWLSGDQVRDTIGAAQAVLAKSASNPFGTQRRWEDRRPIAVAPLRKATNFDVLKADLPFVEAQLALDNANGRSAAEISRLEAERNRAANLLATVRRQA